MKIKNYTWLRHVLKMFIVLYIFLISYVHANNKNILHGSNNTNNKKNHATYTDVTVMVVDANKMSPTAMYLNDHANDFIDSVEKSQQPLQHSESVQHLAISRNLSFTSRVSRNYVQKARFWKNNRKLNRKVAWRYRHVKNCVVGHMYLVYVLV